MTIGRAIWLQYCQIEMNLETSRLLLAPIRENQSQCWFLVSQDSGLTSYQISNYKMVSPVESLDWIRQKLAYLERNEIGTVGVILKESKELIGVCALKYLEEEKYSDVEIMFRLAKKYWGQGYATEIGHSLIDHAKLHLPISRLAATVDPKNLPSKAVLAKLGFKFSSMIEILGHKEELHNLAL
jgi:ribosomal-protein-alanine N-acetyltransferase